MSSPTSTTRISNPSSVVPRRGAIVLRNKHAGSLRGRWSRRQADSVHGACHAWSSSATRGRAKVGSGRHGICESSLWRRGREATEEIRTAACVWWRVGLQIERGGRWLVARVVHDGAWCVVRGSWNAWRECLRLCVGQQGRREAQFSWISGRAFHLLTMKNSV